MRIVDWTHSTIQARNSFNLQDVLGHRDHALLRLSIGSGL